MSKYRMKNLDKGMHSFHCMKCAKKLDPATIVWLELDLYVGAYHDFGGIPEHHSQGLFEFGPDCAELMRAEARTLFAEWDEGIAADIQAGAPRTTFGAYPPPTSR